MFFPVPAALNGDPSAMPFNELFRDEEPDSRADRCTCRKEGVKDLGKASEPIPTPYLYGEHNPVGRVSQSQTETERDPPEEMA